MEVYIVHAKGKESNIVQQKIHDTAVVARSGEMYIIYNIKHVRCILYADLYNVILQNLHIGTCL